MESEVNTREHVSVNQHCLSPFMVSTVFYHGQQARCDELFSTRAIWSFSSRAELGQNICLTAVEQLIYVPSSSLFREVHCHQASVFPAQTRGSICRNATSPVFHPAGQRQIYPHEWWALWPYIYVQQEAGQVNAGWAQRRSHMKLAAQSSPCGLRGGGAPWGMAEAHCEACCGRS